MAEVTREIVYRQVNGEYEPVLSIKPKVQREGHKANFAILVQDAWRYTPDKNHDFDKWMYAAVSTIYDMFNLGIMTTQRMAEVATVIEDGIDDLLKTPPEPPSGSMEEAFKRAVAKAETESCEVRLNG